MKVKVSLFQDTNMIVIYFKELMSAIKFVELAILYDKNLSYSIEDNKEGGEKNDD